MTWEELLAQRRITRESTDHEEIVRLHALAIRNLKDASIQELSLDGRFERAFAAARALATIVVRASGFRVRQPGAHFGTFRALQAADPGLFGYHATLIPRLLNGGAGSSSSLRASEEKAPRTKKTVSLKATAKGRYRKRLGAVFTSPSHQRRRSAFTASDSP